MHNKSYKVQEPTRYDHEENETSGRARRGKKFLFWKNKIRRFFRKVSTRNKRKRFVFNSYDGVGNKDTRLRSSINADNSPQTSQLSSDISLKEQIENIKKDFRLKVRKFVIKIRLGVVGFLSIAVLTDLFTGVYPFLKAVLIILILLFYSSVVIYVYIKKYENKLTFVEDLIYITSEILAVSIALYFGPAGRDAVFTSPLLIFFSFLILLSAMSGRWWYPLYSSIMVSLSVGMMQLSHYEDFYKNHVNTLVVIALPFSQIPWSMAYYIGIGLILSYFFWNAYNMQSEYLRLRTEDILTKTYNTLMMPDGDVEVNNFLLRKLSHLPDKLIGADFCSYRVTGEDILICFGDAAGHGINHSPAAVMTLTIFNACTSNDPQIIMYQINKLLYRNKDEAYCVIVKISKDSFTVTGKCEDMGLLTDQDMKSIPMKSKALGTEAQYFPPTSLDYSFPIGGKLVLRTDGALFNDLNDDQTTLVIIRES